MLYSPTKIRSHLQSIASLSRRWSMKRFGSFVISLFVVAAFGCAIVCAQAVSTSQISGTVKDQTSAVLPGVEVTATQTETGAKRTVVTDETGSYILASLPIGPYRLEATLPGFRTYVQTGITLQVNSNPAIPIVLAVGQVSEQVEVSADAALVETRSTGVGQVIDNQRVLELPLNGRQATRSEEHTSELQSPYDLVCRLLLEK